MHIAFTVFLTAIQAGCAPSIWFGRKQPGNFQGTLSPSVMELSRFLELAQSSRVLSPSWLPPLGAPQPMFLESTRRHQLPTFKPHRGWRQDIHACPAWKGSQLPPHDVLALLGAILELDDGMINHPSLPCHRKSESPNFQKPLHSG